MNELNWDELQISKLIKAEPDNPNIWELVINMGAIINTRTGTNRTTNLRSWTNLLTNNAEHLQGIYNLMPQEIKAALYEGIRESYCASSNKKELQTIGITEAELKAIRHLYNTDTKIQDYAAFMELVEEGIPVSLAANMTA